MDALKKMLYSAGSKPYARHINPLDARAFCISFQFTSRVSVRADFRRMQCIVVESESKHPLEIQSLCYKTLVHDVNGMRARKF